MIKPLFRHGEAAATVQLGQHGVVTRMLWRRTPERTVWPPGLNRLAVAHALAGAGDAYVTVSLAGSLFFNLSPSASQQQVLLYLVVNMAPFVLLAPLIAPAIDRFPGGRRVAAASLFGLRSLFAVALAFVLFDLTFYFFALALLIAGKASGVTRQALVPGLVADPRRLVSANARLARTTTIAAGVGGATGAPLMAAISPLLTLGLACAAFLAASVTAIRLPQPAKWPGIAPTVEYEELHTPTIVATSWALVVVRAAVGYFVFGLAFALRRESEPAWMYGTAVAAYGAGTFAGTVLAPLIRRRYGEERLSAGALVGLAVVAGFGALGPSRSLIVTVAIVLGMAAMIARQGFDAMVQRRAPTASRGRAFARFETRFQIAWVIGAIAATGIGVSIQISMAVLAIALIPAAGLYVQSISEGRAAHVDDPFDLVEIARRRLDRTGEWLRRDQPRVAVTELVGLIDVARATDRPVEPELAARLDGLRESVISGAQPDESSLQWVLERASDLVAALGGGDQEDSTGTSDEDVTVHADERQENVSTQRDESLTER